MTSVIAHRAARLHDGGRAGGRDGIEAVAEREECVRRGDRSRRARRADASAFIRRDLHRIDAAHLPGADGERPIRGGEDQVFDLTCAQMRHANRSACHSSAVGCRFVTTRSSGT